MQILNENELSKIIIACAIEVHKQLGPGMLESAYQECLYYELDKAGLDVQKEKPMPIIYKEVKLDHGYRIDLLVNNKVVIEIKTVEAKPPNQNLCWNKRECCEISNIYSHDRLSTFGIDS